MFGTFSNNCNGVFSQCYTYDEMKEVCNQNGKLHFRSDDLTFMEHILDWKAYLSLGLGATSYKYITDHHSFKVGRAQNGEIQLLYKEWRSIKEWQGSFLDSSGLPIFSKERIQQVPLPLPHFWKPSKPLEPSVPEVIGKLIRSMEGSGVVTDAWRKWFDQFRSISPIPRHLPASLSMILSRVAPIAEELQPAPLPPPSSQPARTLLTQAPRTEASWYADREPLVNELVILEMNEADRATWPSYCFWMARVLECPIGKSNKVQVLWYKRQNGKFTESSRSVPSNIWKVHRSTILFSGFTLTSTGKLHVGNERVFTEHPKIKQFM